MPRELPYVAWLPGQRGIIQDLKVQDELITPDAYVDGATIQGNGAPGNPLRAVGGSIAVAVDGVTIQGNGTVPFPLRVDPAGLAGAIVSAAGVALSGDGTTGNPLAVDVPALAALLFALVGVAVDGVSLAGDGTAGNPLQVAAGGITNGKIANATIALSKLVDIATPSFLGRRSVGVGSTEVITPTQATALLDVFTAVAKGLVPASGGGTANFLRADGSWAVAGFSAVVTTYFGDGSDGNVTIAVNSTITRHMFYNNLTVNAGVTLDPSGYMIFVKGTLTLNGVIGQRGANGATTNSAVVGPVAAFFGGGGNGGAGGNGAGAVGGTGGASARAVRDFTAGQVAGAANSSGANGGPGQGAAGGAGASGASGGTGGTVTLTGGVGGAEVRLPGALMGAAIRNVSGTNWSGGSGGGGGRGGALGGEFGGQGGAGGGVAFVFAFSVVVGAGGLLDCRGGNGGNGQIATTAGGGGGGAGGLVVGVVASGAAPPTNVSGGAGGIGATWNGGTGGNGLAIVYGP